MIGGYIHECIPLCILFWDSQLRLDALYYITRVLIPPLERIFNLVGADVKQWFNEMPKTLIPELVSPRKPKTVQASQTPDRININEHFQSTQCLSCGGLASQSKNFLPYVHIIFSFLSLSLLRPMRRLLPFSGGHYSEPRISNQNQGRTPEERPSYLFFLHRSTHFRWNTMCIP